MKPLFQTRRSLPQKWTALLFVLVMTGFGFVQAVHVHDTEPVQSSVTSHCSLCVVAHSAAIITPTSYRTRRQSLSRHARGIGAATSVASCK